MADDDIAKIVLTAAPAAAASQAAAHTQPRPPDFV